MKTWGVKYLGSKLRLQDALVRKFQQVAPRTALDVFTGTTRVAQVLRGLDVGVTTVDIASYSECFSRTWVSGVHDVQRLTELTRTLNALTPVRGWFTDTYCDVPGVRGGIVRFMMPKNGMRVDAIRHELCDMHARGDITDDEVYALTTCLMLAMDRVDNTVGIQQAYLKQWCKRAYDDLHLNVPWLNMVGPVGNHIAGDCLRVSLPGADMAYIDPPYNEHVYLTNYHIWETIARGDEPDVDLKTNRRTDLVGGGIANEWNRVDTTPDAFRALLARLDARDVVISYAENSHIGIDELLSIVDELRDVVAVERVDVNENIMHSICRNERRPNAKKGRCELIVHASDRAQ